MLVTGGTGYVGAHAIAALAGAGHRIRVLARSPDSIPAALEPLGVDRVETVVGDVTEPAAVERALAGRRRRAARRVGVSMDARRADEMRSVNVRGTDIVLGAADRLGLDPSSTCPASSRYCRRPTVLRSTSRESTPRRSSRPCARAARR